MGNFFYKFLNPKSLGLRNFNWQNFPRLWSGLDLKDNAKRKTFSISFLSQNLWAQETLPGRRVILIYPELSVCLSKRKKITRQNFFLIGTLGNELFILHGLNPD